MIDRCSNDDRAIDTSTRPAVARSENPWSDFSATATCLRTTVGSSDKVQVTGPLIVTRLPMLAPTVSVSQSRTCVVAFSHNHSDAVGTITRRASAAPHSAIRADDCRIDFTSSRGKPCARPYVAGASPCRRRRFSPRSGHKLEQIVQVVIDGNGRVTRQSGSSRTIQSRWANRYDEAFFHR